MNESHFAEIEKTLLFVSEARKRAERAAKELRRDSAEAHLVAALEDAERSLEALGRHLDAADLLRCSQGTALARAH